MDTPTPLRAHVRERSQGQRMKRAERRDAKRLFLLSFAEQGIARTACKVAGISRSIFYAWLKSDPLFNEKYDVLSCAHFDGRWNLMSKEEIKDYLRARKQGFALIRYYQQRERDKRDTLTPA